MGLRVCYNQAVHQAVLVQSTHKDPANACNHIANPKHYLDGLYLHPTPTQSNEFEEYYFFERVSVCGQGSPKNDSEVQVALVLIRTLSYGTTSIQLRWSPFNLGRDVSCRRPDRKKISLYIPVYIIYISKSKKNPLRIWKFSFVNIYIFWPFQK